MFMKKKNANQKEKIERKKKGLKEKMTLCPKNHI